MVQKGAQKCALFFVGQGLAQGLFSLENQFLWKIAAGSDASFNFHDLVAPFYPFNSDRFPIPPSLSARLKSFFIFPSPLSYSLPLSVPPPTTTRCSLQSQGRRSPPRLSNLDPGDQKVVSRVSPTEREKNRPIVYILTALALTAIEAKSATCTHTKCLLFRYTVEGRISSARYLIYRPWMKRKRGGGGGTVLYIESPRDCCLCVGGTSLWAGLASEGPSKNRLRQWHAFACYRKKRYVACC